MFTSAANDWTTPDDFFALLNDEFAFTLDPCCYAHTAKCEHFFTAETDGLSQPWTGRVFMNPPYGKVIGDWIAKAYHSAQDTAEVVVALIPARTCSGWWHRYCMKAAEIRLVCGRLRFGAQQAGKMSVNAPFPNAVVIFRRGDFTPRLTAMPRTRAEAAKELLA